MARRAPAERLARAFCGEGNPGLNNNPRFVAAVLKTESDWSALPPETPTAIQRLLRRCLEPRRRRRLRDIGDALIEIEEGTRDAEKC